MKTSSLEPDITAHRQRLLSYSSLILATCSVAAALNLVSLSPVFADGEVYSEPSEAGLYGDPVIPGEKSGIEGKVADSPTDTSAESSAAAGGSSAGGAQDLPPVAAEPPTLAQAQGERLSSAVGHYARARSLLIASIREFDKGMQKADASPLLDVGGWRNSLINRAQELERVLDPQPRTSRSGVKFEADPRLLGEPK